MGAPPGMWPLGSMSQRVSPKQIILWFMRIKIKRVDKVVKR
jgi:hypothetical protein